MAQHGNSSMIYKCPLCDRNTASLEKHHLVPKLKGGKDTLEICNLCHDQIHMIFTNNELRDDFHSLELLLQAKQLQSWLKFIRKKPGNYNIRFKQSNRTKRKK